MDGLPSKKASYIQHEIPHSNSDSETVAEYTSSGYTGTGGGSSYECISRSTPMPQEAHTFSCYMMADRMRNPNRERSLVNLTHSSHSISRSYDQRYSGSRSPTICQPPPHTTPYYARQGHPDSNFVTRSKSKSLPEQNIFNSKSGSELQVTEVRPGTLFPSLKQLHTAQGYGFRHEDGTYTRLIPADMLPEWNNIPKNNSPEGLVIIPALPLNSARTIRPDHSKDSIRSVRIFLVYSGVI